MMRRFRYKVYLALNEPNPNNGVHIAINAVIVAAILWVVGVGILGTVASLRPSLDRLLWVQYIAFAVFVVEYVFRIWSAVDDPRFTENRFPRLRYAVTPFALIDLLAIAPALLGGGFLSELRIFRLFALFKFSRYSRLISVFFEAMRAAATPFLAGLGMLLLLLVFAASGAYFFEAEAQPDHFGSIPAAAWWGIATLTTVGYGDVYPITVGGRIFGAATMIVGIGIAALPAGLFASAALDVLNKREQDTESLLREKMAAYDELTPEILEQLAFETRTNIKRVKEVAAAIENGSSSADHCPTCGQIVP